MIRFLQKLLKAGDEPRRLILMNDDGSQPLSSYSFNPKKLWFSIPAIILGIVVLTILAIRYTPLSSMLSPQSKMRQSIIEVQQEVVGLEDTLRARTAQLHQMKRIMADEKKLNDESGSSTSSDVASIPARPAAQKDTLSRFSIPPNMSLISNLFQDAPSFPSSYPIAGSDTRGFSLKSSHFGLDIAAADGSPFHAIADGVIISEEWTFNYGYMVILQHAGGLISIYKHARTLQKNIGAPVRQGEALGTIGQVGLLSSGPHLHIEIWKNGIPQDPKNYLIKS